MSVRILKIAVFYLLLGTAMGIAMGVTHQFQYALVHAHVNLLGWVSLASISFIYHIHPESAKTTLAQWHFWLHNLGLPVFMVSLFLRSGGNEQAERAIAVGATVTFAGIVLFVINVLRTVRPAPGEATSPLLRTGAQGSGAR